MARPIPMTKLIILAVVGFGALIMGSIVLTLQVQVIQEKNKRGGVGGKKNVERLDSDSKSDGIDNGSTTPKTSSSSSDDGTTVLLNTLTVKNSIPTSAWDIRLWSLYPAPEGGNFKTIGEAYWRQVQAFLRNWKDASVYPVDPSDYNSYTTEWMVRKSSEYRSFRSSRNNKTDSDGYPHHFYPQLALEQAAEAGHPKAQHYLANAHASGIWPVPAIGGGESAFESSDHKEYAKSLVENLHVFDEWLPSSGNHLRQIDKAYLLWHMAAVGGSLESAMALAYRLDDSSASSSEGGNTCEHVLPYYQAAADGIIDQLEVSLHSRAKVIPYTDKHTLAQVHMHGGTSSQLDWNNKPDESKEALQFYHLKATTVPWSMKKKLNSGSDKKSKNGKKKKLASAEKEVGIDLSAAYTLAHMHHYGVRGVEQNLTKSLEYYEIAGKHGHWESAAAACTFHLWGIGTYQNANRALQFCRIGAPFGYEGCYKRHVKKADVAKNNKRSDDSSQTQVCDENALNGLGLLHLMGVQGVLDVDTAMAENYFALAKAQGSVDAFYNLAMMWLGWKTHFKTVGELNENGFTSDVNNGESVLPIPGQQKKKDASEKYVLYKSAIGDNMYFKGPIQSDVLKAIKMLGFASKLGHLQAKHRLGLIYAQGLNHTTSVIQFNFVKKDCRKAKEYFKWIIDNASQTTSNRLRRAYKEYIAGNLDASVRNYLAAAEIGSTVGQVNAAFLMERGVCLGLDAVDCAKAAVRLWKVAAERGNAEACLRVGDFYYYGRLHRGSLHTGPFGWIQYILVPEEYLPVLFQEWSKKLLNIARNCFGSFETNQLLKSSPSSTICEADDGTCPPNREENRETSFLKNDNLENEMEEDLHTAAHYYQMAGERHQSARANFNLGFMHQWGLGLKQDFPMAKRHYDLALSRNYREAEIAVQIALFAMNTHEFAIRCKVLLEEWWYQRDSSTIENTDTQTSTTVPHSRSSNSAPRAPKSGGEPVQSQPPGYKNEKTYEEVIMSHLFDQSSLMIVILFLLILVIQVIMSFVGRPNRR